ncbi:MULTISPECIES: bifunctional hydroxymethylpyrimidine kinase/phosphomethylpyrimidine kinase [Limosilactobacillus]|uniref:Hydroxymethylpyrimidine/phosphomethylpyrimidine kinase n=1 Tax=Limosilactobacillus panis DSM 6035 TaxID=1423782 RepID=A0A0R1X449_9LACO|nr:bifunctional hydroxymethylpyrimidine kinase/phosphomethylpyrimidine kinase [Limosilactobacillus panis]KRM24958.1 phosphomethylpyrimidine kinase [Limosilactobacillus panis DSM 6035]
MTNDFPQALTIAGTDSGGGAGIAADFKTMQERDVFATMVVVAVTAQNTLGVQDAFPMPPKMIDEQFASLAEDLNIRACKTGMLADAPRVLAVVRNLKKYDFGPVIVDPVMIAKGGAKLLSDDAIATVRDHLLPHASLVTPNLPEAEELTGLKITTEDEMEKAGKALQNLGAKNVLVKGGHFTNANEANDFVLLENGHSFWLTANRINTKNTHGTGDTISSCITAELAKGHSMEKAIRTGKEYVEATIRNGINVGHGHGPLNHWAKIGSEQK